MGKGKDGLKGGERKRTVKDLQEIHSRQCQLSKVLLLLNATGGGEGRGRETHLLEELSLVEAGFLRQVSERVSVS